MNIKTSKHQKLQPAKQALFPLISEAAAHMNFTLNFVKFFATPILYNIMILMYKIGALKNLAKFTG